MTTASLPSAPGGKRVLWTLLLILCVAAALRFPFLDAAPPGVYPDEAINGVQGWEAAQSGDFKIFYPENNGREGLLINLIGFSEKVLGPSAFALRLWPAIFGLLTVLGLFVLARHLLGSDSIALLAAFFVAVSLWHVNFSRIAFAGIQVPFFLCWGIGLFLAARAARSSVTAYALSALGGALFGLGFHSYSAYRFAPFVAIVVAATVWPKGSQERGKTARLAWIWAAAALVPTVPLALYFFEHPEDFFGRANQVSVWNQPDPLGSFMSAAIDTLEMFHLTGDGNWRHNIAGSPQLLLPVGAAFLLGVWVCGQRAWRQRKLREKLFHRYTVPLWWTAVMLLPAALTFEGIPHALRSIGAIPGVMMLAAIGFDWLYRTVDEPLFKRLLWASIGVILIVQSYRYFGVWANDPATARAFNREYVEIGRRLNALPPGVPRFVIVEARGGAAPHRNPDGEVKRLPMPAQTVIFETLGHPQAVYLLPHEAQDYVFPPNAHIETVRE